MQKRTYDAYTGKNVNVVFIDNGQSTRCTTYNYTGEVITNTGNHMTHAEKCVHVAQETAKNINAMLIDASDKNLGVVTEATLIRALSLAESFKPNIISISLSVPTASKALVGQIHKLVDNGTIVCAATNLFTPHAYPHSVKGVLAINEWVCSDCTDQDIYVYDDQLYISCQLYENIEGRGSSFATAYFCAICAKILEFSPLATSQSILNFYKNFTVQRKPKDKCDINSTTKKAFYLFNRNHDIKDNAILLTKEYQYYIDPDHMQVKTVDSGESVGRGEIDEIDVIVADDYAIERPVIDGSKFGEQIRIQYFDNIVCDQNSDYEFDSRIILNISVPSICICSYGKNMEKSNIQRYLDKHLQSDGLKVGNITFNPIGKLSGYNWIQYPQKIQFPDTYSLINQKMSKISRSSDILVTSVAGDFDRYLFSHRKVGDLCNLFFDIHQPDIVILSTSDFVDVAELIRVRHYVESVLGATLILYVTNKSKDDTLHFSKAQNLLISEERLISYQNQLKKAFGDNIVYSKKDLSNADLYNHIISLLTK